MAIKLKQIAFQFKMARASVFVRDGPVGFFMGIYWSQRAENNVLSSNTEGNP